MAVCSESREVGDIPGISPSGNKLPIGVNAGRSALEASVPKRSSLSVDEAPVGVDVARSALDANDNVEGSIWKIKPPVDVSAIRSPPEGSDIVKGRKMPRVDLSLVILLKLLLQICRMQTILNSRKREVVQRIYCKIYATSASS